MHDAPSEGHLYGQREESGSETGPNAARIMK